MGREQNGALDYGGQFSSVQERDSWQDILVKLFLVRGLRFLSWSLIHESTISAGWNMQSLGKELCSRGYSCSLVYTISNGISVGMAECVVASYFCNGLNWITLVEVAEEVAERLEALPSGACLRYLIMMTMIDL